jgi:spore germination cell wall hydrolase CwlJ-like protein
LRAGGRALVQALAVIVALMTGRVAAGDLGFTIVPATFSPAIAQIRATTPPVDAPPRITDEVLAAYVARQQQLKSFDGFSVKAQPALTETVLLGYIARKRNPALEAIDSAEITPVPALTPDIVADYAHSKFVPTVKRIRHVQSEELCLAQAIYHEARGESDQGQMAVANIVVNRALSAKYPSTICGVVFQNADQGLYKCQFTFACDGRSDMGTERGAWNKAARLADVAYREFQQGKRPGVIPGNALYYHTTSVQPRWSQTMRRVAAIGAHVFYAAN